ncbi:glycosyltransferase family 2 protein [Sphingomonas sp. CFBP 13728]|uniref:glycosyltransferase family 2 protein n=1 Tax=Sphingomonas sp. CFBP 13728 TaxID=2775294 RepID=UPI0017875868|nr:glycosyltransferase family 2 protein [Sphingomonas sp. CFBP 13728]MBD8621099.1 glycosyltransferase family 2 protein [Sphingomonas sp. CFBP 13728]
MPRISLVTVTYNGVSVWPEFYASLAAQEGVDWHLVVIDNDSRDATVEMVREANDPRITLIVNEDNLGVAAANNQGIRWAMDHEFEHIVLINNDTAFDSGMLRQLSATAQTTDAGAVSALIPYYDRPDLSWYSAGHFSALRGMQSLHDGSEKPIGALSEPYKTDYAPTCCVLFKAEVFRKIGLMDETYFVYWDDVDFLWRMKKARIGIVVDPRAVMLHKVSVSTGGRLSDFSIRYGHRNQIFFARKFFGGLYAAYVTAYTTLVGVARMVLVGDTWHNFRVRMKAVGEGWQMKKI